MSNINKLGLLFVLPVLLAGCSSITNLTPTQYPRDASGYYRVEAMWSSSRKVIRPESFKPLVVVDFDNYPMRPVPLVVNRWEAFVPVPADKDSIHFHFKFDYTEDAFGKPKGRANSLMSGTYQLTVK